MSEESTVKLLWNCALALNAETHTKKLLKSYFMTTCRKICKNNVQMPKSKFSVSEMCPRCSLFWCENDFRMKHKPQKVARTSKVRKLIAKLNEASKTKGSGILTKSQRRRAKWLKKRACSNIEIQCENCKNKTQIPLQKPIKRPVTLQPKEEDATKKTKRNNKRKDPTAGLMINPAIKTKSKRKVRDRSNNISINKDITSKEPLKAITEEHSVKQMSSEIINQSFSMKVPQTPDREMIPAKSTGSTKLTTIAKNNKKKKKKNENNATSLTRAIQSKTQKKNSLLQLAALLKKKDTTTSKTPQSRLESLLK